MRSLVAPHKPLVVVACSSESCPDVVNHLFDDPQLRPETVIAPGKTSYGNAFQSRIRTDSLAECEDVLRDMRKVTNEFAGGILVGEPYFATIHELAKLRSHSRRAPMQWNGDTSARFSTSRHTWLAVAPEYEKVNAATESRDPNSLLNFYRDLLRPRKTNDPFAPAASNSSTPPTPTTDKSSR